MMARQVRIRRQIRSDERADQVGERAKERTQVVRTEARAAVASAQRFLEQLADVA